MEDYFEIFRLNMKFYREQLPSFEMIVNIAAALKIHPADLFLRNASTTVANTKEILREKLLPQIETFIEREL